MKREVLGLQVSPPDTRPDVLVRNISGIDQGHGRHVIPADGEFHPVPAALADRLATEPNNYQIDGIGNWDDGRKREPIIAWERRPFEHPMTRRIGGKIPPSAAKHQVAEWPHVGVVIPVYNGAKLLATCLKHLDSRQYQGKFDIILVSNGCDDEATKRLFLGRRLVALKERSGFAFAVNRGAELAFEHGAEYVVLFNQDCEAQDPEWLKNLIGFMESRPDCGVAGAKLLYPDGLIQHAGMFLPPKVEGAHIGRNQPSNFSEVDWHRRVYAVTGAVLAVRKDVWQSLGGMDEGYPFGSEDVDFCLRAQVELGSEVWYCATSTVVHQDGALRTADKQTEQMVKAALAKGVERFNKRWGDYALRAATEEVAIVLPSNRVNDESEPRQMLFWNLANRLIESGQETVIYTFDGQGPKVSDFVPLFETRQISQLAEVDTLIATGWQSVGVCRPMKAKRRFYLIQSDETECRGYLGCSEDEISRMCGEQPYRVIAVGGEFSAAIPSSEMVVVDADVVSQIVSNILL
jgi:GT2 family glycosyltransferase